MSGVINKRALILFFVSFALVFIVQGILIVDFLGSFLLQGVFFSFLLSFFMTFFAVIGFENAFNILFDNRIKIGVMLFIVLTAFQLHGSSINMFDDYIQPNSYDPGAKEILGDSKAIRSDEWMVQTPINILQSNTGSEYKNDYLRGTNTDMFAILRSPVKSVGTLGVLFNLGFIFLGPAFGLSFWWFGRLIALVLFSIEFFLVLTKNKKLSLLGGIIIALSLPMTWWFSTYVVDQVIFGLAAITFTYYFFTSSRDVHKIIYSILFWICLLNYGFSMYLATLVPFSYMFLIIFIWIIRNNFRKFTKFDYLGNIIGFSLFIIACIVFIKSSREAIELMLNTVYPGNRVDIVGTKNLSLSYVYSPLFRFDDIIGNPSENSSFISFFPITYIMSIYYMIRSKNISKLIYPLFALATFLLIYQNVYIGDFLNKITFFSFSTGARSRIVFEFILVIMMILMLNTKIVVDKLFYYFAGFAFTSTVIMLIVTYNNIYSDIFESYILENKFALAIIFMLNIYFICTVIMYLFTLNGKKYVRFKPRKIFAVLTTVTLISGFVFVNPLSRGIDVITDKPLAKEITRLDSQDSGKWVTINSSLPISNYVLAQGVPVINSTNFYPNFDLLEKLDQDGEYEFVFNRYAHITYNFTFDETSFELVQPDYYIVNLNVDDFYLLDAKYVVTEAQIEDEYLEELNLERVYSEENILIYKNRDLE